MRSRQPSNPLFQAVRLGVLLGLTLQLVPAAAAAAPPPQRPESQQEFWARYDQKDWSAAIEEARQLVEQARATSQPQQLANALTLLGNAQLSGGDKINAETSYREALQIVESSGVRSGVVLIDPLRGLGYTLALLNRHQEAVPYMERALLLSHRTHGLFDLGQLGLLRQLAVSLGQTGRLVEGAKQMLYLQRVGESAYGAADPRMAPVLCVIGDWYIDTGNFLLGRERYRDAMEIVERKLGKKDPALVQPLRATARSYVQEVYFATQGYLPFQNRLLLDPQAAEPKGVNPKYMSSDGEKALQRAITILEARPDTSPALMADTLIQLGDWYQLKQQSEKALTQYRRAAALVSSSDPATAEKAPLSFPVRVYYPLPPLAMRNRQLPPEEIEEKFVAVQFTVNDKGHVEDAKVIEQNGTERQASEALHAVRGSRYRPKFINGEPVATEGVVNREVFRMRKQDDEEGQS